MRSILIVCSKKWFFENNEVKKFIKKKNIHVIKIKKKLNIQNLKKIKPKKIFFPHWSNKVPNNIINNYECICFHTAPLPYGRGGSPIQNLILRNKKKSPVCAIKMTDKIDAGPLYCKKEISLEGNLNEIFSKIARVTLKMIKLINQKKIKPKEQRGNTIYFKRIKEKDSQIPTNLQIKKIYDRIRMVDSLEYPNAYFKIKNIKIEFKNAIIKKNHILCNAKITKKN